jgi:ABC-type sulfate transport system permease component
MFMGLSFARASGPVGGVVVLGGNCVKDVKADAMMVS